MQHIKVLSMCCYLWNSALRCIDQCVLSNAVIGINRKTKKVYDLNGSKLLKSQQHCKKTWQNVAIVKEPRKTRQLMKNTRNTAFVFSWFSAVPTDNNMFKIFLQSIWISNTLADFAYQQFWVRHFGWWRWLSSPDSWHCSSRLRCLSHQSCFGQRAGRRAVHSEVASYGKWDCHLLWSQADRHDTTSPAALAHLQPCSWVWLVHYVPRRDLQDARLSEDSTSGGCLHRK